MVARGEIARLIKIEANIDGQYMTTYKTDGIIMATATGSTGYALAARGPVLYPESRDFLLIPIAPHLSLDYALVLPETAEVQLRLATYHTPILSVDGHINLTLSGDDTLVIKRSPNTARFRRIRPKKYFYSSLEEKLRGK